MAGIITRQLPNGRTSRSVNWRFTEGENKVKTKEEIEKEKEKVKTPESLEAARKKIQAMKARQKRPQTPERKVWSTLHKYRI